MKKIFLVFTLFFVSITQVNALYTPTPNIQNLWLQIQNIINSKPQGERVVFANQLHEKIEAILPRYESKHSIYNPLSYFSAQLVKNYSLVDTWSNPIATGTSATTWTVNQPVTISLTGTKLQSGNCFSGVFMNNLGIFNNSGWLFSGELNSVEVIEDMGSCYVVGLSLDIPKNEIRWYLLGSNFAILRQKISSFYSLNRVSGVFSDYFVFQFNVSELLQFGTGNFYTIVSPSGDIAIKPGPYSYITNLGNGIFEVQVSPSGTRMQIDSNN